MVLSPREVQTAQQEVISPTRSQQQAAALATLSKKVEAEPKKGKALSPSELVAQGLAAAAAAAAHAAAPFASFGNAVPFRAVTSRMQNAAAAGQSTAVATIATVTAAVSSNFNKEHSKAPKESQAADPTQWFVCDDPVSHTRYFVIQGSETIDHWRVNLSFDPVVFEDKSLGVKVIMLALFHAAWTQLPHHLFASRIYTCSCTFCLACQNKDFCFCLRSVFLRCCRIPNLPHWWSVHKTCPTFWLSWICACSVCVCKSLTSTVCAYRCTVECM